MILDLLIASIVTFFLGFFLLRQYLSSKISFAVMFIKIGIPVAYFLSVGVLWAPYDGRKFQRLAAGLLNEDITPWSFLFNLDFVVNFVGSTHVAPYWLNVFGQYFFGPHYFSAIFVNILATILTGIYIIFILSRTGFSKTYYKYFFIFFLLHWDVLTYSSLLNIKGILIGLLIVMYFYHHIMMDSSTRLTLSVYHFAVMIGILFIMYWSRFYVISILLASSIMWVIIESNPKKWIPISAIGAVGLYPVVRIGLQFQDTRYFQFDILTILGTVPRILLTPRPWGVLPQFAFLIPSSIAHWLLIIPAMAYSGRLWVQEKNMRLLLCYLVVFVGFYSVFFELASARMRYQIAFVLAIGQYHFLWSLSRAITLERISEISVKFTPS
jgi:hypothetical protein